MMFLLQIFLVSNIACRLGVPHDLIRAFVFPSVTRFGAETRADQPGSHNGFDEAELGATWPRIDEPASTCTTPARGSQDSQI